LLPVRVNVCDQSREKSQATSAASACLSEA
jgi:hypothetical protein